MTKLHLFSSLIVTLLVFCVLALLYLLKIITAVSFSKTKVSIRWVRVKSLDKSKEQDLSCDYIQIGKLYVIGREYKSFYKIADPSSVKLAATYGFVAKEDVELIEDK